MNTPQTSMFFRPSNYLLPIFNWTTTNPLRFVIGLVLFGMFASAPRMLQNTANKTPERVVRAAYATLERGKGEEALKQFEKAESMPNVTKVTSAKIHLGKAIAYQRDLEIINIAKPTIIEKAASPRQTMQEIEGKEKILRQMISQELNQAQTASQKSGIFSCSETVVAAFKSLGTPKTGTWTQFLKDTKSCQKA